MGNSSIHARLTKHFGTDPAKLAVVANELDKYQRPNLHLAVSEILDNSDCQSELTGVIEYDYEPRLSRLALRGSKNDFHEGPVEYINVALAGGETLACVKKGLYCIRSAGRPFAMLVTESDSFMGKLNVEVMADERGVAEAFLRRVVQRTQHGDAFRGKVLSLAFDCYRQTIVEYHQLPRISHEQLILPAAVLERIERHTTVFSQHAESLRQARRHMKRGILLYGPPGTGKTLTAMHLAGQMAGRTVLLMTGQGVASMETACKIAKLLQPATVILEDIDLIGTERHRQAVDANALLFELLNQMDGLAEDCDVLFILTTNRPDILEPALAARPGRIDQAIEIPLPDAESRKRLFDLYSESLPVELADWNSIIDRTEGVSAAFIRELLRKAAVIAVAQSPGDGWVVGESHIHSALEELLVAGGELTKSLLGASGAEAGLDDIE